LSAPLLRRITRPVGRLRYTIPTGWLLFSVMGLGHANWQFEAGLVMSVLWLPIWVLATLGRLRNLDWSRWLILPLLLPWAALVGVLLLANARLSWFLTAMAVVVAAEAPLILVAGEDTDDGEELFER
jgi:hypothetical protein